MAIRIDWFVKPLLVSLYIIDEPDNKALYITATINSAAIKLMQFRDSDASWFRWIEVKFTLSRITSQQKKHDQFLSCSCRFIGLGLYGCVIAWYLYVCPLYWRLSVSENVRSLTVKAYIVSLEPLDERLPSKLWSQMLLVRVDITIDNILRAILHSSKIVKRSSRVLGRQVLCDFSTGRDSPWIP